MDLKKLQMLKIKIQEIQKNKNKSDIKLRFTEENRIC